MDWKGIFKPTISKILLVFILLIMFTLIFGIPFSRFAFCKMCADIKNCPPCPKYISFYSIKEFMNNRQYINDGIWSVWHIYLLEIIVSYLVACLIVGIVSRLKSKK